MVRRDRIRVEVLHVSAPTPGSGESKRLEWIKTSTALSKVLIWPIVLIARLLWFHEPISDVVRILPQKIAAADKLSIFSLSVEIQRRAAERGRPAIATKLKQVSAPAIEELLKIGRTSRVGILQTVSDPVSARYSIPSEHDLAVLRELESKELLEVVHWSNKTEEKLRLDDFVRVVRRIPGARFTKDNLGGSWSFSVSPEEAHRLGQYSYRLTELGRESLDLIIEVVAEQLAIAKESK